MAKGKAAEEHDAAVALAARLLEADDPPRLVAAVVGARYPHALAVIGQVLRDARCRTG